MSISEPIKFLTPWAESGLKNPIPADSDPVTGRAGFNQGFPAINMTPKESGGIPPFGQDFNGIFFDITSALRYMQAGGRPTFSAELAAAIGGYPKGAVVMGDDGVAAFQNSIDSNSNNPNSGGIGWVRVDPYALTQQSGILTPVANWTDVPSYSDPNFSEPLNAQAEALAARSELLKIDVREALRRSYAEVGYNLVGGSFEAGGTLVNANDALLHESSGKAYSGPAGAVPPETDPIAGGFTDRSGALIRNLLGSAGMAFFHVGDEPQIKLRNAIEYGNTNGVPISCAGFGDFAITGTDDIMVKTSLDFAGLTVDVSQWTGKFLVQDGAGYVSHGPSSPLVQALIAQGVQSGAKLKGWDALTDADDSYVRIKTNQPFFTYRGNVVMREEYNKHSRYGMLESSLKYSMDPTTITEILVLKIAKKKKEFGNVNFYLGSRDQPGQPSVVKTQYGSLIDIKVIRFTMNNVTYQNGNPVLVDVWDSCYINLADVYCQWPMYTTATSGYTYDISINNCYGVTMERCDGIGDGWGATGNNSSRIVKIRDSKLSRIDFHQPFHELLEVSDTKIGDAGIVITAIGDLVLNEVEFIRADRTKTGYDGAYIIARSDTGGFCDGNLIINGLKINFDSETPHNLLRHFGDVAQPKPAGSPINYRFWDSIVINQVRNDFGGTLGLFPIVQSGVGIKYPASIAIRDTISGNFKFSGNLSSLTPSLATSIDSQVNIVAPSNLNIVLDNVKLIYTEQLSLVDTTANNFRIHASMRKVHGTQGGKSISTLLNFSGVLDLYDCDIEDINFNTGGVVTKYLDINLQGGELNYQARFSSFLVNGFAAGKTNVKIASSRIALPEAYAVHANALSQCRLVGNSYYNPTDGVSEMLRLPLPSGQSVGIAAAINPANSYVLEMAGNNKWAPFVLPKAVNEASYIQQSASSNATVTRNSATSLFLSGSTTAPTAVWIA